jgi:phosphotriesterase-related protein
MVSGCAGQSGPLTDVNTALGPVKVDALGPVLMHEHLYYDEGAKGTLTEQQANYTDRQAMVDAIVAGLKALKASGGNTIIDASPRGLSRDPELAKECAEKAGVNIILATGVFTSPLVPEDVKTKSVNDLAKEWIGEIENGMEGTGVKAGIIKIAMAPGNKLLPLEETAIRAAARAARKTGVLLECHDTWAPKFPEVIRVAKEEKLPLNRLVWVHADSTGVLQAAIDAAKQGVWLDIDSASLVTIPGRTQFIKGLVDAGLTGQILLSQDYYAYRLSDGQANGAWAELYTGFKEYALSHGLDEVTLNQLMIENPHRALAGE